MISSRRTITGVVLFIALFLLQTNLVAHASESVKEFKDTKGHWAEATILWGIKNNVTSGYPNGTFKPNASVTEAEFLAFLFKAYSQNTELKDQSSTKCNSLAEIDQTLCDAIAAYEQTSKEPVTETTDETKLNHWADTFYINAHEKGYPLKGYTDLIARDSAILRVTVAEIISAADGANYKGDDAIQYILGKGYSTGTAKEITIANYKGNNKLTRAEAVQFIKNLQENGLVGLKPNSPTPTNPRYLPDLPKPLPAFTSKLLGAANTELKKAGYEGYEVIANDDSINISKGNSNKISIDISTKFDVTVITLWDGEDPKAVALTIAIAKAGGITLTPKIITDVIDNRKKYTDKDFVVENQTYSVYGVLISFFKSK